MSRFTLLLTEMSGKPPTIAAPVDGSNRDAMELLHAVMGNEYVDGTGELRWKHSAKRPTDLPDWVLLLPELVAVSERFREVIDAHRASTDDFSWLSAAVEDYAGAQHTRWIPHFRRRLDVLNEHATSWGPSGLPMLWFLDPAKTAGKRVFAIPGLVSHMIVTEQVLHDLRSQGMTGFTAQRARISD